jgi:hypothetical protein
MRVDLIGSLEFKVCNDVIKNGCIISSHACALKTAVLFFARFSLRKLTKKR